jgi:peptidyl-prolyl cis-trans isomerase SurA
MRLPLVSLPLFIFLAVFSVAKPFAYAEDFVLDTVVASVNGKPITLHDIEERMRVQEPLSIETAAQDPRVRFVLDELIVHRLIEAECERRKLRVDDHDIERYIAEVAKRNNMTVEQFSTALQGEGRSLSEYRQEVRIDILRGKLTADMMRAMPPAPDAEVRTYIKEHPELKKAGTHVSLRQILVSTETRPDAQAQQRMMEAQHRIQAGSPFADIARQFSDAPEASTGGLLGVLLLEELAGPIRETISTLPARQLSSVLRSAAGYHLFWIDERVETTARSSTELRQEVRTLLERQKFQAKIAEFFSKDIYERHAVEKKL